MTTKAKTNVEYRNDVNALKLTGFSGTDLDMLMLVISKVKEKGSEKLYFRYPELKEAVGMSSQNDTYFTKHLQEMADKLKKVGGSVGNGKSFDSFVLFPTFHATAVDEDSETFGHLEKGTLVVRVNPDYEFLLNELNKHFTRFELCEFVKLESKYSKNLYRLLKQYRRTGKYRVAADRFRELMDCPKSYSNKIFMRDCVNVAIKELSRGYFENLNVEPIRGEGRGKPIVTYEFTFKKSKEVSGQYNIDDFKEDKEQPKQSKNKFNNFTQRQYDFDELEKQLVGSQNFGDDQD